MKNPKLNCVPVPKTADGSAKTPLPAISPARKMAAVTMLNPPPPILSRNLRKVCILINY